MPNYHVTFGSKKKLVTLQDVYNSEILRLHIRKAFGLEADVVFQLQLFNKEWDDWVDVDLDDPLLTDGGKLQLLTGNQQEPAVTQLVLSYCVCSIFHCLEVCFENNATLP